MRHACAHLVPPFLHPINQTITGYLRGDPVDKQCVGRRHQDTNGRDFRLGLNIVIDGLGRHATFATPRKGAKVHGRLRIHGNPQGLLKIGHLFTKGMPAHLVEGLIAEQISKLKLIQTEINRAEGELETPLTDEAIQTLLLFSMEFAERLEAVEQTYAGHRVVIDGLDVTVVAFRREGAVWLRLTSILRPKGKQVALS